MAVEIGAEGFPEAQSVPSQIRFMPGAASYSLSIPPVNKPMMSTVGEVVDEGLGEEFEDTPWVPPTVKRVGGRWWYWVVFRLPPSWWADMFLKDLGMRKRIANQVSADEVSYRREYCVLHGASTLIYPWAKR